MPLCLSNAAIFQLKISHSKEPKSKTRHPLSNKVCQRNKTKAAVNVIFCRFLYNILIAPIKLSIKQKEFCYFGLPRGAEWSAECCNCFRLIFGSQRAPDESRPRAICPPLNPPRSPHSTHTHKRAHDDGSVNMLKLGDNILIRHDHPLTRGQADQMLHGGEEDERGERRSRR